MAAVLNIRRLKVSVGWMSLSWEVDEELVAGTPLRRIYTLHLCLLPRLPLKVVYRKRSF